MGCKMCLSDYLRARANSADEECRTDDADAMRDAAEALEYRADEIERLNARLEEAERLIKILKDHEGCESSLLS